MSGQSIAHDTPVTATSGGPATIQPVVVRRPRSTWWKGLLFPIALFGIAEILADATNLQSDSIAPPSEVMVAGWEALLDGSLLGSNLCRPNLRLVLLHLLGVGHLPI